VGVVIRQSAKQSVITFFGVAVGAINVLFIYPLTLTVEQLGLLRFVMDTGMLFAPFVVFGLNHVIIKYYPYFKTQNSNRNNGLLSFALLGTAIFSLLCCLLVWAFKTPIYNYYTAQNPLYQNVLFLFAPISVLMAFCFCFTAFEQSLKRIVVAQIFNNIYIKIGVPILALFYYFGWLNLTFLFYGVIAIYILSMFSHVLYIKFLGQLNFNLYFFRFINKKQFNEIMVYATFALLSSFGSFVVLRIDSFMVSTLSGLEDNGVYTIAAFIANAIAMPTLAVMGITAPLVAQFWKDDNHAEIENLYKKSSLNLLIIGCWLLICVFVGIDYLFEIMPNGNAFKAGKWVVLILGLSKLFDMATSINQHIIGYSKWFKFNFYALLFLSVFNIACNYIFIPKYQIMGAAIASFSALALFNLLKFGFIYYKFKMQPFSKETLIVLAFAFIAGLIPFYIPLNFHPIINLFIKCSIVSLLFLGPVLFFRLSNDLNRMLKTIVGKIIK